jgi:hypothetical protein
MKIFVQGTGRALTLGANEFRAQGGEGEVYVSSGRAYKIYKDASRMIQVGKIRELAKISRAEIVKPEEVLVDKAGNAIGYGMLAVPPSFPLVKLFPQTFRAAHGLTPDHSLKLVRAIQEMNFLVATADLARAYFIDVDSYKTASYPATAIMDSARDWLAGDHFTEATDWFSFALLAFNLWIGIHPYKGTHPTLRGAGALKRRAEQRISVLNPQVSMPATCLPLSVIPSAYRAWFEALFERGERQPPPEGAVESITVMPVRAVVTVTDAGEVRMVLVREVEGRILELFSDIVLTSENLYVGSAAAPSHGVEYVAVTPKQRRPVLASLAPELSPSGMRRLVLAEVRPGGGQAPIQTALEAHDLLAVAGRLILKVGTQFIEVQWIEPPNGAPLRTAGHPIGNAMMNATTLHQGLAVQMMLGATYLSLFPGPGSCVTLRMQELDGYRVIDARFERLVVQVVAERGGQYSRFVFRFDSALTQHDTEVVDVTATGPSDINFAVLDSGTCVQINEAEELELSSGKNGASSPKRIIRDPGIDSNLRLFADGARLLGARDGKIYHLTLK